MSIKKEIERLSDWYDANRPDVKVLRVEATKETVLRLFKPLAKGGPPQYRGREIICLRQSTPKEAADSAHRETAHHDD